MKDRICLRCRKGVGRNDDRNDDKRSQERKARHDSSSHRASSCPSWDRTRTLLIQSQACCQLHQGAIVTPSLGQNTHNSSPAVALRHPLPMVHEVAVGTVLRRSHPVSLEYDSRLVMQGKRKREATLGQRDRRGAALS